MANHRIRILGATLVLSAFGLSIGCGDSQIHREAIAKLPVDSQHRSGKAPTLTPDGKFTDPKANQDAETAIENQLSTDTAYTDLAANMWPKGTYVLTSVDTFAKFMPNASKNWVNVFNSNQVKITSGVASASTTSKPITVGIFTNQTDPGLGVQIPVTFDTKLTAPFLDDMSVNKDDLQIFVSKLVSSGRALGVNDHFEAAFNGAIPFDAALAGTYGKPSVKASLQKIDETHYQAKLTSDDTTTIKGTTISRTLIFVYVFTPTAPTKVADPKNAAAPAPAPTPADEVI